jgi:hypothetical protein
MELWSDKSTEAGAGSFSIWRRALSGVIFHFWYTAVNHISKKLAPQPHQNRKARTKAADFLGMQPPPYICNRTVNYASAHGKYVVLFLKLVKIILHGKTYLVGY